MVTLRYLTELLGGMICPAKLRQVCGACLEQLIKRSLVLEWLGVRPWEVTHSMMVLASFCRSSTSLLVLIGLYSRMSSA